HINRFLFRSRGFRKQGRRSEKSQTACGIAASARRRTRDGVTGWSLAVHDPARDSAGRDCGFSGPERASRRLTRYNSDSRRVVPAGWGRLGGVVMATVDDVDQGQVGEAEAGGERPRLAWDESVALAPLGVGWDAEPVVIDWFGKGNPDLLVSS